MRYGFGAHVFCLLAVCMACSCTQSGRPSAEPESAVVADQKFWGGQEGNAARRLTAKFDDRTKMGEILNLNQPIMDFAGRRWVLGDIVVRIDLNANGIVAMWDVSGPKPVIDAYLLRMNGLSRKSESGIYDYGTETINCRPTAAFGTTEK